MEQLNIEIMLGQEVIYQTITNDYINKSYIIKADLGQGKSHLIDMLESFFKTKKSTISLKLCPLFPTYDYSPFLTKIAKYESVITNVAVDAVKAMTLAIPYVGKAINRITDVDTFSVQFNSVEKEILKKLKNIITQKNVVFLCEDIEKWDSASIAFLSKLLKNNVFSKKTSFVCTTSESQIIDESLFDKIFSLNPFPKTETQNLCYHFNPSLSLTKEICNELYDITTGNIGLLKASILNVKTIEDLSSNNFRDMIYNKINQVMPLQVDDLMNLLDKAALIGEESYKILLQKFTNIPSSTFNALLTELFNLLILQDKVEVVKFLNTSLWKSLYKHSNQNYEFHYDLAQAIKCLYPSNFERIADELLLSNNEKEAAVYYILSSVQMAINYKCLPNLTESKIELIKKYNLYESYLKLYDSCEKCYNGKGAFCERLYVQEEKLQFELDYLYFVGKINYSIEYDCYKDIYDNINGWIDDKAFANENPMQWLRMALLKLSVGYELHDKNAKHILREVDRIFRKYIPTDKNFEIMHYEFLSRSNFCFSIDIAHDNSIKAEEYFCKNQNLLPTAHKYHTSLNNALANSIEMGDINLINQYCDKAIALLNDNTLTDRNVIMCLTNNLYISLMSYHKDIFKTELDNIKNNILTLISNENDVISKIILKNNLAIFYMYCGLKKEAKEIIDELYHYIQYNCNVDDYYKYIILNNYILMNYINTGEFDHKIFENIENLNPLDNDIKYFKARNIYIKEKVNIKFTIDMSKENWNDFEAIKVGPSWAFWGKWFLTSTLQFWTD